MHETLVNMTIDDLDARLIATLRANPRVGLLEVARQLGVARGTAQARLANLEGLEADATSGPHDLICRVVARDTEHLQELVNDMLATPAIRRCTSYIVLSRQVPPRTGPLVATAG